MLLPVSGRALPILVAKKPRMLVATRESPSRLRLPPGPCCPRFSTVLVSRCTLSCCFTHTRCSKRRERSCDTVGADFLKTTSIPAQLGRVFDKQAPLVQCVHWPVAGDVTTLENQSSNSSFSRLIYAYNIIPVSE